LGGESGGQNGWRSTKSGDKNVGGKTSQRKKWSERRRPAIGKRVVRQRRGVGRGEGLQSLGSGRWFIKKGKSSQHQRGPRGKRPQNQRAEGIEGGGFILFPKGKGSASQRRSALGTTPAGIDGQGPQYLRKRFGAPAPGETNVIRTSRPPGQGKSWALQKKTSPPRTLTQGQKGKATQNKPRGQM